MKILIPKGDNCFKCVFFDGEWSYCRLFEIELEYEDCDYLKCSSCCNKEVIHVEYEE